MKKHILHILSAAMLTAAVLLCCSCEQTCNHSWGEWEVGRAATCVREGFMIRECEKCDEDEELRIKKTEHTIVTDAAKAATCTEAGLTEGSHCSVCEEVFTEQKSIPAPGHKAVRLDAKAATCTEAGLTEGSRCSVCDEVLTEQKSIPAPGHDYSKTVISEASCDKQGEVRFSCRKCDDTYTEKTSLPTYSATEIYNQAVKYTGEIVTYDKQGNEYAIGTGFVISSDGRVVTNYHVIEGAYSAKITIGEKSYNIVSVLAYDKNIDAAVLKINTSSHPYATVCKKDIAVGSTVYAIGSPRGLTNTYTQGIITAAGRVIDGVKYLQTDASITHGNSGGPLINSWGEVVGINTWGLADSQNLNFSIFVSELDRLDYSKPLTMAQLYELERNPYDTLINYILANYTYTYNSGAVSVEYIDEEALYELYYDPADDYLSIDFSYEFDDGDFASVYINLEEGYNPYWGGIYFFDGDEEPSIEMYGTISAASFTPSSTVSYSDYEGSSSNKTAAQELFNTMIHDLLEWFDLYSDANGVGVTLADFGFTNY